MLGGVALARRPDLRRLAGPMLGGDQREPAGLTSAGSPA